MKLQVLLSLAAVMWAGSSVLAEGDQNVTVDSTPVNGGRGALKAAGVTITGAGKFKVGDPQGMFLLVR